MKNSLHSPSLRSWIAVGIILATATSGCWSRSENEVVVYTSQDLEFAEPIFRDFEHATNKKIAAKYDTEATKTVGLTEAVVAERDRPRCDVFWNNEILNTLRLQRRGLLEAYVSPQDQNYPAEYRDPKGFWHGFAARARVLVVNTNLVPKDARPTSIRDLTDPRWRGKIGIAKPLFGTTATHATCLFAAWGDDKAKEYFRAIKANGVQVLGGNRQVAASAGAGQIAFGITDTDDALAEVEKGSPVVLVYPDNQPDGLGTLFIPNTLAIVKNCPHAEAARQLVDYLLSPAVEDQLALGPAAQIPLNQQSQKKPRIETPRTVKPMKVDWNTAVDKWDVTAKFLREEFTGP